MTSALCVTVPCPGSMAALHREPRGLGSHLCFPALDCECTQGSPSRHSSVPLAPGPQRGHSSLCPHIALFGFLSAVSALGPHCSVPGGSSNSCCCPWDFQSLHLRLSGVSIHGLGGPVGQCRVAWRPSGVCTPTTYLCQKLWRHPSSSHLFRLWQGLCTGWMWK